MPLSIPPHIFQKLRKRFWTGKGRKRTSRDFILKNTFKIKINFTLEFLKMMSDIKY